MSSINVGLKPRYVIQHTEEFITPGWHEERKPDCKTPLHRRLTKAMKRELVHSLRTVALLAMFSEDSNVTSNVATALKWMALMEPDLILQPILERAVPALENLTEVRRTPRKDNNKIVLMLRADAEDPGSYQGTRCSGSCHCFTRHLRGRC